jgi:2-keto-4-pentenoate hydratase/2-oxohepta-3-ene-1,7-dioic acid hydratase in catechol pathway
MIFGVVDGHLARRGIDAVELLDVPYPELGSALRAGLDVAALASAPVLRRLDRDAASLAAPVGPCSALWAVGLAYADHAAEAEAAVGKHDKLDLPALFLMASSSITGPQDAIVLPALAPEAVDYEGEVAVVIGSQARAIPPDDGWRHVFGVTAANDVSARDVQQGRFFGGLQDPTKAKSFDTFTPLGPWVVTPDEFADRDAIALRTWVNGELRQEARTSQLLRPISAIVSAVSQFATLQPGDVILTGTPQGVGMSHGQYLAAGDEVTVEVELVGELRNPVAEPVRSGEDPSKQGEIRHEHPAR